MFNQEIRAMQDKNSVASDAVAQAIKADAETLIVGDVVYVRDIDIATALGYGRDLNIRDAIRRHLDDFKELDNGELIERQSNVASGNGATTLVSEYFLNYEHAVCIALPPKTPKARRLILGVIKFYSFWGTSSRLSPKEQTTASFQARSSQATVVNAAVALKMRSDAMRAAADNLQRQAEKAAQRAAAIASAASNFQRH